MSLKALAEKVASKKAKHRRIVVIIDDDESVLKALKLVLGRIFEVHTFSDPEEGATAATGPNVAVAVIDIKMPTHDGFWVYRRIRGMDSNVPIIFNSAYQDATAPAEMETTYRPFAYLQKNGNLLDFVNTVKKAAAGRG